MIKFIKTNFNYNITEYIRENTQNSTIFITNNNNINYFKKEMINNHLNNKIKVTSLFSLVKQIYRHHINNKLILDVDKQRLYFILAFNKVNHKLVLLKDYNTSVIDNIINIYNNEHQNCLKKTSFTSDLYKEVYLVIQEYLKQISGYFVDTNMLFDEVINYINENNYCNNDIIIDYLPFLTKIEQRFIKVLSANNKIIMFMYNDKIQSKNELLSDLYNNLKTVDDIEIEINNIIDCEKVSYLDETVYDESINSIKIYEAKDLYNEISFVCNQILKLIKEEGAGLDDFTIVANNFNDYEIYFDSIFLYNNINYNKKEKIDYKLFEFIIKILKLPLDLCNQDIIELLSYNYIKIDATHLSKYTNEVNFNHLQKEPFKIVDEYINNLILKINNLKKINNNEFVKELYYIVYSILNNNNYNFDENLNGYNYFITFINNYLEIFNNEPFNLNDFINTFEYWFTNINVKENYLNEIKIVNLSDAYTIKTKYVFFIGLNEGIVPGKLNQNLLINNPLKEYINYPLFDGLLKEQFNILYLLISSNTIYLSYPKVDSSNKKINSSSLIKKVTSIYPKMEIIKDDIYLSSHSKLLFSYQYKSSDDNKFIQEIDNYFNINEINMRIEKFYYPNHLDKSIYNKVLNDKLYLSASKIDNFVKCPFKYYLENIIKLNPSEKEVYDNRLVGTFIHGLLEYLINNYDINDVNDYVNSFVNNHFIFKDSINRYLLNKLISNTNFIWNKIKEELYNNKFKPSYTELNINDNKLKKVNYNVNNVTINMTGIIDRIDEFNNYMRIIDYKTGDKKLDFNEFVNGINLQLFIYMSIMDKQNNKIVSGIFYMPAFVSFNNNQDLRLKGIFLNNQEVIKSLGEDNIDDYIASYSRGKLDENVLYDIDKYKNIISFTDNKIREIASDIISGNIDIKPIKSTKICDYCQFKNICGTEERTKNNRKIIKYSKEEINNMIGGEGNG